MNGHTVVVLAAIAVLVVALVPTPAQSTNHEMTPRDDDNDNEAFHDDMRSQDATDENGIAQDSQAGDELGKNLNVMWIFRVINEDNEPVSGARVVIDNFDTDASGGTLYVSVHACGDVHHFQVNDVKLSLDRDEVLEQVEGALLTDELPGVPIGTVLTTDFYENVAIGILQIPCDSATDAEPTDEQEVESDDVDVSVDNEWVDFTWPRTNLRDYEIEATNKRSEPMTDFKVCIPDKDDGLSPSPLTEEDAEDVVEPERVPDGWSYSYENTDDDGDNDCLVLEAEEGEGIDEGEKLSVELRSEYSGEENIGVVQYVPSYGRDDNHEDGDDTTGLGPVPFAVSSTDPAERALATGSVRAGRMSSVVEPPTAERRIDAWREDAVGRYNPAVERGDVPGFVSRLVERRLLVRFTDGGTVAVRTDGDGKVISMEPVTDEEAAAFDQRVTVETDAATVESVRGAKEPESVARSAVGNGDVRLYGEGVLSSFKTRAGTAGARLTGGSGAGVGGGGVEMSGLGYGYVEDAGGAAGNASEARGETGTVAKEVVDRNGGVRGVTTQGAQELIEAGGKEGLSENAGVYGETRSWSREPSRTEYISERIYDRAQNRVRDRDQAASDRERRGRRSHGDGERRRRRRRFGGRWR